MKHDIIRITRLSTIIASLMVATWTSLPLQAQNNWWNLNLPGSYDQEACFSFHGNTYEDAFATIQVRKATSYTNGACVIHYMTGDYVRKVPRGAQVYSYRTAVRSQEECFAWANPNTWFVVNEGVREYKCYYAEFFPANYDCKLYYWQSRLRGIRTSNTPIPRDPQLDETDKRLDRIFEKLGIR